MNTLMTNVNISNFRAFKELGKLNCGQFVPGKVAGDRNFQSRFLWSVPPGIVGRIAMDKKSRG